MNKQKFYTSTRTWLTNSIVVSASLLPLSFTGCGSGSGPYKEAVSTPTLDVYNCDTEDALVFSGTCNGPNGENLTLKCVSSDDPDISYESTGLTCTSKEWSKTVDGTDSLFGENIDCTIEDTEFGISSPTLSFTCE